MKELRRNKISHILNVIYNRNNKQHTRFHDRRDNNRETAVGSIVAAPNSIMIIISKIKDEQTNIKL